MKEIILAVMILANCSAPWVKAAPEERNPQSAEPTASFCEREPMEDVTSDQFYEEPVTETAEADDGCWEFSAICTVTHYCHCAKCNGAKWAYQPTASGTWPEAGRTVAVDKSVIPLGSEVLIGGHIYIAEDTGVTGCHVDIFCDSHSEAKERGMYTAEVFWR